MIKVAYVTSSIDNGGITNVLYLYAKFIDRGKFLPVILTYSCNSEIKERFTKINVEVVAVPNPKRNYNEFLSALKKSNVSVIHCCTSLNSGYVMKAAFDAEVETRITHSHASKNYHKSLIYPFYAYLMRRWISKYSTSCIACSEKAGEYLFKKHPFTVFPNAIDASQYSYSKTKRDEVRRLWNIDPNAIVIGNIGMFSRAKNQAYLISVLHQCLQNNHQIKLMLVGDGLLYGEAKQLVLKYNVQGQVIFTGWSAEPNDYYSCFDVFALPSISEGFPLVVLEAIANGLQCVVSDAVSKEVNLINRVEFLPIQTSCESQWAEELIKKATQVRGENCLLNSNYDINTRIKDLEELYLNKSNFTVMKEG